MDLKAFLERLSSTGRRGRRVRTRASFRSEKDGGELEGLGSAKRMDLERVSGGLDNGDHRLDAMPLPGEGIQALDRAGL